MSAKAWMVASAMAMSSMLDKIPFYKLTRGFGDGARAISRSKYDPHQGPRECARRLRQIEAGIIKR